MRKGHIPIRQCVGCKIRRPAEEMIRLKAVGDTVVAVSHGENVNGRSCYSCPNWKCLEAAINKNKLERVLRRKVAALPTPEILLKGLEKKERLDDNVDR